VFTSVKLALTRLPQGASSSLAVFALQNLTGLPALLLKPRSLSEREESETLLIGLVGQVRGLTAMAIRSPTSGDPVHEAQDVSASRQVSISTAATTSAGQPAARRSSRRKAEPRRTLSASAASPDASSSILMLARVSDPAAWPRPLTGGLDVSSLCSSQLAPCVSPSVPVSLPLLPRRDGCHIDLSAGFDRQFAAQWFARQARRTRHTRGWSALPWPFPFIRIRFER
jgi:hypothetical protein